MVDDPGKKTLPVAPHALYMCGGGGRARTPSVDDRTLMTPWTPPYDVQPESGRRRRPTRPQFMAIQSAATRPHEGSRCRRSRRLDESPWCRRRMWRALEWMHETPGGQYCR